MEKSWRVRLAEAKLRGHFTGKEIQDALSWTTCAVGEAHQTYEKIEYDPDDEESGPMDEELIHLGSTFYSNVSANYIDDARDTYNKIQARVQELINAD